MLNKQQKNKKK